MNLDGRNKKKLCLKPLKCNSHKPKCKQKRRTQRRYNSRIGYILERCFALLYYNIALFVPFQKVIFLFINFYFIVIIKCDFVCLHFGQFLLHIYKMLWFLDFNFHFFAMKSTIADQSRVCMSVFLLRFIYRLVYAQSDWFLNIIQWTMWIECAKCQRELRFNEKTTLFRTLSYLWLGQFVIKSTKIA